MGILTVITVLLAVVGIALVLYRPQYTILILIIMFPLEQLLQSYFPFLAEHNTLVNIGIGMLTVFAVVSLSMRGERIFQNYLNPVMIMLLTIYLIDHVGLLWTPATDYAVARVATGRPYYVLMVLLAPLILKNLEDFRRLLVPLLIVSIILALLLLTNPNASMFGRSRLVLEVQGGTGTTGPLALGTLGGMTTIIGALFVPARRSMLVAALRLVGIVIGFGLALMSGSRGQVLAAAFVAVVLFPVARKIKNTQEFFVGALMFFIVVGALYAAMQLFLDPGAAARWEGSENAVSGRLDRVSALLGAFVASPAHWLFGLGPQAFSAVGNMDEGHVHNQVVEILCESGLVAFALFCMSWLFVFRHWRGVWQMHAESPVYRSVATCFFGLFLYEFILSLKQGTHVGIPFVYMWMLLLAKTSLTEKQLAASAAYQEHELDEWADSIDLPEAGSELSPAT